MKNEYTLVELLEEEFFAEAIEQENFTQEELLELAAAYSG